MSSDSSQNTAECSTKEYEDNTNENGEMNAMVNNLRSSIEGVQNSFSAIYSTLAVNLKQSLEMIQAMNSMMEQFLLSNININAQEESNPNLLTVIISNTSQFPAQKASCNLTFQKKGEDKDAIVKIECVESVVRGIKNFSNSNSGLKPSSPLSIFVQKSCIGPSTSDVLFTLPPQTQIIEKLKLIPSELAQYNAKISLEFPSPGTGKPLQTEHSFDLYLME
ncbi:41580_t:CDS:2 [Gigaspora margarita]|uniref:41580_t:CDS:1 n=1 Tax=Gigaspora margarita TaxID=4874 RepID=A0ABN7URY3_GIGMA|nr:41580_t:CDS:2 [Gigaspora margarita]